MEINIPVGFGGWEDQASHLVQGTLLSLVQQAVLCHLGVTCQSNSAGLLLPLVVGSALVHFVVPITIKYVMSRVSLGRALSGGQECNWNVRKDQSLW